MAYKGDVHAEPDAIFGKLNWDVIPYSDPVILPVMITCVLGGLGLLATLHVKVSGNTYGTIGLHPLTIRR